MLDVFELFDSIGKRSWLCRVFNGMYGFWGKKNVLDLRGFCKILFFWFYKFVIVWSNEDFLYLEGFIIRSDFLGVSWKFRFVKRIVFKLGVKIEMFFRIRFGLIFFDMYFVL